MKDVTVICLSLFSDGLSTTTPTILFNLYCLATNQKAQDRVYKEILSTMKDEKDVTPEHINRMPYLKAFIRETFRQEELILLVVLAVSPKTGNATLTSTPNRLLFQNISKWY